MFSPPPGVGTQSPHQAPPLGRRRPPPPGRRPHPEGIPAPRGREQRRKAPGRHHPHPGQPLAAASGTRVLCTLVSNE